MAFGSLSFLFVFLPAALALYYLCPRALKNAALVCDSLVFYAWGSPACLAVLGFSLLFNYCAGLQLGLCASNGRRGGARALLVLAVVVNVGLLAFYKYAGFLTDNLSALLGMSLRAPELPVPPGVSFFTFTVLSYLIDVYRGKAPAERNFFCYGAYVTLFPKLLSGPIAQYAALAPQLRGRQHSLAGFGMSVNQFLVGLGKKVLLADSLGAAFAAIHGQTQCTALAAWLGCICYSLQLYFDFSGYSDMAIGLARMFGFRLEKNFDYPYLSTSVSEFWRRWHISLGAWFRDYIYIPLGGNRCAVPRQIFNLLVVWILTGIWHGAAWNFVFWGLYHGCFVLLEKFVLRRFSEHIPKFLRHVYLILVVMIGWVFFFSPTVGSALQYLGCMFGRYGWADSTAHYYLASNLWLVLLGLLGCAPLLRRVHQKLAYAHGGVATVISVICYALVAVACVACLVNSTYSSFLYFQF